jgi:hypothetical protein
MPVNVKNGRPYLEPERHDELSDGAPAVLQADARAERTEGGKLAKGARTVPAMGGRAKKNTTHLSHRIDSATLTDTYRRRAQTLRRATCAELARSVGAGVCGIIPSLFVKHASVATALAEQALDRGDTDRAVKYAEASRMHLLYARELCVKDAASRPRGPVNVLAQIMGTKS